MDDEKTDECAKKNGHYTKRSKVTMIDADFSVRVCSHMVRCKKV